MIIIYIILWAPEGGPEIKGERSRSVSRNWDERVFSISGSQKLEENGSSLRHHSRLFSSTKWNSTCIESASYNKQVNTGHEWMIKEISNWVHSGYIIPYHWLLRSYKCWCSCHAGGWCIQLYRLRFVQRGREHIKRKQSEGSNITIMATKFP